MQMILFLLLALWPIAGLASINKANNLSMFGKYDEAEKLYIEAVESGNYEGYYYIGMLELNGYGRDKSIPNAIQYYTKAASHGVAIAQYELSVLYSSKDHGVYNPEKYLYWLKEAVKNNHPKATHNLATIAIRRQKTATALHYFNKAAELDYAPSIYSLGQIYYNGLGVEKDFKKAFEYLHSANELGEKQARYSLATLYERGLGTEKDLEKAEELYYQLYSKGDLNAGYNLALLFIENNKAEQGNLIIEDLIESDFAKAKNYKEKLADTQ